MSESVLLLDEGLDAAGPRWGRCGGALPPVRLGRVGGLYFVEDGHHRIAATTGRPTVVATIRPVCTVAAVPAGLARAELPRLEAAREFLQVVPLPDAATVQLNRTRDVDHAALARRARRWAAAWWVAG